MDASVVPHHGSIGFDISKMEASDLIGCLDSLSPPLCFSSDESNMLLGDHLCDSYTVSLPVRPTDKQLSVTFHTKSWRNYEVINQAS